MRTLTIDIGGTGIKMLILGEDGRPQTERARERTPRPSTPEAVLEVIGRMVQAQPAFDRVSVGFPGVVTQGIVRTAPNLGTESWAGHDLQSEIALLAKKPVRVINDADLQGYGVILGKGVEMVVTLGTGMGTALYIDGRLIPNLELGHHPFRKDRTYEQYVNDEELARIGKERWNRRVARVIEQLAPIWNYDLLHIGGGNARKLEVALPANVRIFQNVEGMTGGARLWELEGFEPSAGRWASAAPPRAEVPTDPETAAERLS